MKNNFKKYVALILVMAGMLSLFGGCSFGTQKLTQVFDHVFEVETYKSLDYDYAGKYFAGEYDNYGGGCSAVAKVNDEGDTIIGRNMDLNISNKAAYILHTDVKGCYKTVGLSYTFRDISPDYETVMEHGLPKDYSKILPFMADDVLNEKGLFIEVNMRNGEFWPTGESKFSCSGTNPDSDERVYMFALPRYIGEHCATVEEALEYVKTLDVYSKDGYWNYCFLIADATGHYGVLEFAMNKVIWNDYQQAQTNFYVNEDLYAIETMRTGCGRYDNLMKGIDAVQTEAQMFDLMDSVTYWQVYDIDNCKFDYRTEDVGTLPFATYDFVMDEANREFIDYYMRQFGETVRALPRQALQDANEYWESSFTEVINCNRKTILVRFFEDDEKTITVSVY